MLDLRFAFYSLEKIITLSLVPATTHRCTITRPVAGSCPSFTLVTPRLKSLGYECGPAVTRRKRYRGLPTRGNLAIIITGSA